MPDPNAKLFDLVVKRNVLSLHDLDVGGDLRVYFFPGCLDYRKIGGDLG